MPELKKGAMFNLLFRMGTLNTTLGAPSRTVGLQYPSGGLLERWHGQVVSLKGVFTAVTAPRTYISYELLSTGLGTILVVGATCVRPARIITCRIISKVISIIVTMSAIFILDVYIYTHATAGPTQPQADPNSRCHAGLHGLIRGCHQPCETATQVTRCVIEALQGPETSPIFQSHVPGIAVSFITLNIPRDSVGNFA